MEKQFTQLITLFLVFISQLSGMGSYEILNFSQDSRSLALHNSSSAYDSHILGNNPAALSLFDEKTTYSYFTIPANISSAQFQKNKRIKLGMYVGKLLFINYGSIADGETTAQTNAYDAVFEIGYKSELKKILSIGISGGYLLSSISDHNSQVLFAKIGLRTRMLRKRIGIGLSLENVGFIVSSYTKIKEPLPTIFRSSIYYKPFYLPIIINTDLVHHFNSQSIEFLGGIEFIASKQFIFRIGYSSNRGNLLTNNFSSDFLAGVSGGVGFQFKKIILDIGFMSFGNTGFVIGFSVINKLK